MKLGNFSSVDPDRSGKGLARGNALERVIWDEFAGDTEYLYRVANGISSLAEPAQVSEPIRGFDPEGKEEEFPEGRLLTRLHIARERNQKAVKAKKRSVLASSGRLRCEACDFDFLETYGELGEDFAECHHRVPLSDLKEGARTKEADLAIVCANCHRMLHKSRPVMQVEDLRDLIQQRRNARSG